MRHYTGGIFAAFCGLCTAFGAQAASSPIALKRIAIGGNANLQAFAINNHDSIAVTLYDSSSTALGSVVLRGNTATTLPQPNSAFGPPQAQAIDDQGRVLVWARNPNTGVVTMFLYANGAYDPSYDETLEAPLSNNANSPPNPFGFGGANEVFFTYFISFSEPTDGSYGKPSHIRQVPTQATFNTIDSMNKSGIVAGTSYGLSGQGIVFVGAKKDFITLAPPSAKSVIGGYINDSGMVAGTFEDTSGVRHGYVYQSGAYTIFDMPEAASAIAVTAINNNGRVVGTYEGSADGMEHAFLYNGTTVTPFGTWKGYDTPAVAINDKGKMVVRVIKEGKSITYESYRATCTGTAC
jgi:probable HAF family extracellular repeat protein